MTENMKTYSETLTENRIDIIDFLKEELLDSSKLTDAMKIVAASEERFNEIFSKAVETTYFSKFFVTFRDLCKEVAHKVNCGYSFKVDQKFEDVIEGQRQRQMKSAFN